jgi:hypothetical protein
MVRITEEEITDIDGRVKRVCKVEAAHARIESPDGTVEEYSDINAEEWPWTPEGKPPEWRVFGIPMHEVFEPTSIISWDNSVKISRGHNPSFLQRRESRNAKYRDRCWLQTLLNPGLGPE